MQQKLTTRIQHKTDTYKNWEKATNFTPLKGEIIIYTTDENDEDKIGLKIGNGQDNVNALPFVETAAADGAGGGTATPQIQSDWLQENPSKKDYIKNKPFYDNSVNIKWTGPTSEFIDVSDTLNVISYKVSDKIIDKQDIIGYEVKWTENGNDILSFIIDNSNIVPVDDNFFIIFDDAAGLIGICLKDGTYNFMGVTFENATSGIWFNYNPFTNYGPLSLSKTDIKQIEEKFIPDLNKYIKSSEKGVTIPTLDQDGKISQSQIPFIPGAGGLDEQIDWEQSDIGATNYIKNKPFEETNISFNVEYEQQKDFETITFNPSEVGLHEITLVHNNVSELEDITYYKVSDQILTEDMLLNSTLFVSGASSDEALLLKFLVNGKIEIPINITQEIIDLELIYRDLNNECLIWGPLAICSVDDTTFYTESEGEIYFPEAGVYFGTNSEYGGAIKLESKKTLLINEDDIVLPYTESLNIIGKKVSPNFIPKDSLKNSIISIAMDGAILFLDFRNSIVSNFIDAIVSPLNNGWKFSVNNNGEEVIYCCSLQEREEVYPGVFLDPGFWMIQGLYEGELAFGLLDYKWIKNLKKIDNKFIEQSEDTSYLTMSFIPFDMIFNNNIETVMGTTIDFIGANTTKISFAEADAALYGNLDGEISSELLINNCCFPNLKLKDTVIIDYIPDQLGVIEEWPEKNFFYTFTIPTAYNMLTGEGSYNNYILLLDFDYTFNFEKQQKIIAVRSLFQDNMFLAIPFPAGGGAVDTDEELNIDSTNPISNKAVTAALSQVDAISLNGYKFNVTTELPDPSMVDDYTITFVI